MCNTNEHDFAVLSVSDKEMCTAEEDKIAYYNPASLFCKKCGFICHIKANVHSEFKKKVKTFAEERQERWERFVRNPEEPYNPFPYDPFKEEYFDPVERVFKR